MDDAVVSLKAKLLEKEREVADLRRKLEQMEKVLSCLYTSYSSDVTLQHIFLCFITKYVQHDSNEMLFSHYSFVFFLSAHVCCKQMENDIFHVNLNVDIFFNYYY